MQGTSDHLDLIAVTLFGTLAIYRFLFPEAECILNQYIAAIVTYPKYSFTREGSFTPSRIGSDAIIALANTRVCG